MLPAKQQPQHRSPQMPQATVLAMAMVMVMVMCHLSVMDLVTSKQLPDQLSLAMALAMVMVGDYFFCP